MDVTPYTEPRVPPQKLMELLPERAERVRFYLPRADGGWDPVTWAEYGAMIRKSALFLADLVQPGERAAIFSPNRVEWSAAALGIQSVGGAMVPIYFSSTAGGAGYVVEHSDTRVVFVDTESMVERVIRGWEHFHDVRKVVLFSDDLEPWKVAERLRAEGVQTPSAEVLEEKFVSWSQAMAIGAERDAADPQAFDKRLSAVSLEDVGVMLYTSGTSGRPKGVPLTHHNIGESNRDWMSTLGPLLDEGMTDLLWLPMSHIFGFGEVGIGNMLGWVSYMTDPKNVMALLPEVKPTAFMSVPSVWDKLAGLARAAGDDPATQHAKLEEVTGGRFKFCLSGGAGLKREVKELFLAAGHLIIEGYGLTECSPTLTMNQPGNYRFDSVGLPFPQVELKLAEDGEILAKGPNIFAGYHKNPEATAECFTEDGWFKTGDVGRFTEDGFLQIVDRKNDILVTSGGKNVPPANIEIRANDDATIDHLVVYGDGEKYLVAGLWPNAEGLTAAMTEAGLDAKDPGSRRSFLQTRVDMVNDGLPSYMTIKKFVIVDEPLTVEGGLLTPTLKVKRKAVYERYGDRMKALYGA